MTIWARFRTFLVVWFGQTVSAFGTGLTLFGVSAWIFLETGSVSQLAVVTMAATLPRSVLAPFAGAYVDRWDRRTAMLVADGGSGLATLTLVALFATDTASLGAISAVVAVSSTFAAFQWPAYQAATTLLVPREQYSRAQGLIQLSDAANGLLPPAVAGTLLALGGISTVIAVDLVTFAIAVATLLTVRFPRPDETDVGRAAGGTLMREAAFGFRYIWRRPGWVGLMAVQFLRNAVGAVTIILLTGYVLTVADEQTLGLVVSVSAGGSLAGAVVMTAWRGAERKVAVILLTTGVAGALYALVGVVASLVGVGALLFGVGLASAVQNATYRALWQAKVEPDVQGRVFAARMAIALIALPIAYGVVGPLLDHVFTPLADAGAAWFGTGPGAPYRAFFAVSGAVLAAGMALAWLARPLRQLESDIPDFRAPVPPPGAGSTGEAAVVADEDGDGWLLPTSDRN